MHIAMVTSSDKQGIPHPHITCA